MAVSPYNKLKVRRQIRNTQKQAARAGDQVGEHFERHVTRRWSNLLQVRRFVFGWLFLVVILGGGVIIQTRSLGALYQTEVAADGGVLVEGAVGEIQNFNPIFVGSAPDNTASKLIFNGLLRYDENNTLVGDLAQDWSVSDDGTVYIVNLRDDIVWHDGVPLTNSDVIFTINAIQHPDTRSSLNASWRDVTVQETSEGSLSFTLSNPFTPFIHSLTVGILPQHILGEVKPIELRAHPFNLQPRVGTGPFIYDQLILEDAISQVELVANERYHRGSPRLDRFIVRSFEDHEQMIKAYNDGQLSTMAGLRSFDVNLVEQQDNSDIYDTTLYNQVFVFLNNSDPLLADLDVRRALNYATNKDTLFELLNSRYPVGRGPLLPSHLGFDPTIQQAGYSLDTANKVLDEAGWKRGEDGVRIKGEQRLSFSFVSQSTEEFPQIVEALQRQWQEIGAEVSVQLVTAADFQQNHVVPHNYQALLANVSLGVDPDQFVYWHSSQAVVRGFNFSEYKNDEVDLALEAGRTRTDEVLREAKYKAFLEQWVADVPAIALYRPGFAYVHEKQVDGYTNRQIVAPVDRLNDVHEWTVNTVTVSREL